MAASTSVDSLVWLARLKRTQGRKGELWAEVLTDFPERFAERRNLFLINEKNPSTPPQPVELVHHWPHKGGIVLHFAGIDSISAAEPLAGQLVAISSAERAPLEEDAFYIGDLVGCALVDVTPAEAQTVGPIHDVDTTAGPVALLVVNEPGSPQEILIPFAKSYLRRVDLEAKRLEMALPEGLIELNR